MHNEILECVQSLKNDLIIKLSQGEKWVLGFSAWEELPPSKQIENSSFKKVPENLLGQKKQVIDSKPLETPVLKVMPQKEIVKKNTLFLSHSSEKYPIVFVRLCPPNPEANTGPEGDLATRSEDEGAILLEKIISAMKWQSQEVYKTFLCSSSSDTLSDEQLKEHTKKFFKDISLFKPKIVIAWGERVSQILTGIRKNIEDLHDTFIPHPQGFVLMSSWDPIYLIKRPEFKKQVWDDLKRITQYLK